ncbi:MAG: MarR family transcriptional regulator [Oscillospiraceae bacterium]|nr:MarR family transcriptional regulator [Oscillospiraceae bacterium]
MDYTALADELLDVRANLLQVPANQRLSQMERGERFVLNYLATHDKIIHPKELSEKMSVSTARIASLLNNMESKKLILRYTDKGDNRQVIVILTDLGREEIFRIRAEVISYICSMLEKLGPEDAEAYVRIQKKIWNNYLAER